MAFDRTSLTTTVKNGSGGTKVFGYLPPHGLTLADGESVTFDGDMIGRLLMGAGVGSGTRDLDAMLDDIASGSLVISALPGNQGVGPKWRYGETKPVILPVEAATVINIGDFIMLVGTYAEAAGDQADGGTEALNQAAFHDAFVGIALDASAEDETDPIRVATAGVWELTTLSASYAVGDLAGVDEAVSGTALTDQTVTEVSTSDKSIGRVVKAVTSATAVLVDIFSTLIAPTLYGTPVAPVAVTVAIAAGAANSVNATFTVVDGAGTTIAAVHALEVLIARTAAATAGLTATGASGNLTASTGAILTALTAKKHVTLVTAASGIAVLNLVDAAKTEGEYFIAKNPVNGRLHASAATVTASYG